MPCSYRDGIDWLELVISNTWQLNSFFCFCFFVFSVTFWRNYFKHSINIWQNRYEKIYMQKLVYKAFGKNKIYINFSFVYCHRNHVTLCKKIFKNLSFFLSPSLPPLFLFLSVFLQLTNLIQIYPVLLAPCVCVCIC